MGARRSGGENAWGRPTDVLSPVFRSTVRTAVGDLSSEPSSYIFVGSSLERAGPLRPAS
jgi:hypothetical protein